VKNSLIITVVVCTMLVATGFAANAPTPGQSPYVGSQTPDRHFQNYEELRPFLVSDQGDLTAMCDDDKSEPAPRVQLGTADSREFPGYAY
jgi:hypothetical protein